jgi:general secretion pathway protein M
MDTQIRAIKAALTAWLEARAPREKLLLGAGGGLLMAMLIYSVLWAPAWDGRARITAELPELETQLADVRMQAEEARRLKGAAAIRPPSGIALRDALAASLGQAGIADPQLSVLGKGVQVNAKNAPFSAWMTWLNDVRETDHLRVVNAHAAGDVLPGHATVSVTLEPAGQ